MHLSVRRADQRGELYRTRREKAISNLERELVAADRDLVPWF
jgi:hypothetical protein